jgi:hypothetical protein
MKRLDGLLLGFLVIGSLLLFGACLWLRVRAWHQRGMERVRRYEQWVETGVLGPIGPTREFKRIARTAQIVCLICVASTLSTVAAPALGSMITNPPTSSRDLRMSTTTVTYQSPAIDTAPARQSPECDQNGMARVFESVPPAIAGPAESTILQDGFAQIGCPRGVIPVNNAWITTFSSGEILMTSSYGYNTLIPTGLSTSWFEQQLDTGSVDGVTPIVETQNANLQLVTTEKSQCALVFSSTLKSEATSLLTPALSAAFVNLVVELRRIPYNVWLNGPSLYVFDSVSSKSPVTITESQGAVEVGGGQTLYLDDLQNCQGSAFMNMAIGKQ